MLSEGDEAAIKAREAELQEAIPEALGVRLLGTDVGEPNYDAIPPITYASIEMMRKSAADGESPAPEVLLMGEKEQHVAVVTPLKVADDAPVIGHVLVGLDVATLSKAVKDADLMIIINKRKAQRYQWERQAEKIRERWSEPPALINPFDK